MDSNPLKPKYLLDIIDMKVNVTIVITYGIATFVIYNSFHLHHPKPIPPWLAKLSMVRTMG